jgi:hypothetical protein
MSLRLLGFDYSRQDRRQKPTDYARFTVYEPLRVAVDEGIESVDLGVGTLHAKLLRGAAITPLYGLFALPAGIAVRQRGGGDELRLRRVLDQSSKLHAATVELWRVGT